MRNYSDSILGRISILSKETTSLINKLLNQTTDTDSEETNEWIESFESLLKEKGEQRAEYILLNLLKQAHSKNVDIPISLDTPYINTISSENEPPFPGDEKLEKRIRAWNRWNAAVMVTRAQRPGIGVGGHISSYASTATLYEVGFNHFFKGKSHPDGGDHVFFQGHTSPGIYARAFLEGRLSQEQLDGFRQEKSAFPNGIPSYPHPRSMPDFWEFPTVSMGLGPAQAIHQAWINKYLFHRQIKDTSKQKIWAFLGDGEMDEPESRGMLQLASKQELDNLIFVVNCNLQRLDGPVRGNGKIIQELEAFFKGAGWNVIKLIWGSGWDTLLNADKEGALVDIMNECVDGDYQTFRANDGSYIRKHFFGRDPRTAKLVEDWTDEQIWALQRGGHDYHKVYTAYKAASEHTGQPTVILAHTIKGWKLGSHFAGRNSTHQMKKLSLEDLKDLRDRLRIPITDEQLEKDPYAPPYYMPDKDNEAYIYMMNKRKQLGGFLPSVHTNAPSLPIPDDKLFTLFSKGSGSTKVASTMAFVRILKDLIKDPQIGKYFAPIIPDEARTFGMESLFPTAKIFNILGQNYTPVDSKMMLSYRESKQGQILHTGINEAGSATTLQALGTSHLTNNVHMIPVYLLYSMFGFQRTGDQFWAAGDQRSKGFIIGATAGKTTLQGEGTQHMDGHSPILAGTNRAVVQYDPAYAYEIAHIVKDGLKRMYGNEIERAGKDPNVMYYLTVYNEPIIQPSEPKNLDIQGLLKGIYNRFTSDSNSQLQVQLLASGIAVPWAEKAKKLLEQDWNVSAGVWSVTSWQELRRQALDIENQNWLNPLAPKKIPYITEILSKHSGPYIATSDYDHLVLDQISKWIPGSYHTLGADGFGFSDTRIAARRFYHIDAESMVVRALYALATENKIKFSIVNDAIKKYDLYNVNALSK